MKISHQIESSFFRSNVISNSPSLLLLKQYILKSVSYFPAPEKRFVLEYEGNM